MASPSPSWPHLTYSEREHLLTVADSAWGRPPGLDPAKGVTEVVARPRSGQWRRRGALPTWIRPRAARRWAAWPRSARRGLLGLDPAKGDVEEAARPRSGSSNNKVSRLIFNILGAKYITIYDLALLCAMAGGVPDPEL
ncbi:unnamed protein product [Miscanthus lutarioriparius]|uniref:Uncharacterized protein n=1 Tax=Miscanthus lutarioriparius TaxID=422564 RepID=A0A811ME26_9POAL|nr:unnamed protein product [Miscanthus lutarioriparius]